MTWIDSPKRSRVDGPRWIQTPPDRIGLRVPIPSEKNRNVGVIHFLGHTCILRERQHWLNRWFWMLKMNTLGYIYIIIYIAILIWTNYFSGFSVETKKVWQDWLVKIGEFVDWSCYFQGVEDMWCWNNFPTTTPITNRLFDWIILLFTQILWNIRLQMRYLSWLFLGGFWLQDWWIKPPRMPLANEGLYPHHLWYGMFTYIWLFAFGKCR